MFLSGAEILLISFFRRGRRQGAYRSPAPPIACFFLRESLTWYSTPTYRENFRKSQKCESPEMQEARGSEPVGCNWNREKQEQGWVSCRVLSISSSLISFCLSYLRQDENQNFPFLTTQETQERRRGITAWGVCIYSNGGEAQKLSHCGGEALCGVGVQKHGPSRPVSRLQLALNINCFCDNRRPIYSIGTPRCVADTLARNKNRRVDLISLLSDMIRQ